MKTCVFDEGGVCVICKKPTRFAAASRTCCGAPGCTANATLGFAEKVQNFVAAAAQHVAAGMPMASDEEIIRRHDICLACEHLQNDACNLCGCPVSRVAGYVSKLSWADQECPIGKWGKATPSG